MLLPHITRIKSSSKSPTQIKNILRAGIKFENGIGRGRDKKPAVMIIDMPQMIWLARLCTTGCLKVDIFEVKLLNLTAAL